MNDGFDIKDLLDVQKSMERIASDMAKESKKFLKNQGKKLTKENKKAYNADGIGEKTGRLKKSFKTGKVYKYRGTGAYSVRAYNSSPHAHLIDRGWIHKSKNGNEKFVPGFEFMEEAQENFESDYYDGVEEFMRGMLSGSFKRW